MRSTPSPDPSRRGEGDPHVSRPEVNRIAIKAAEVVSADPFLPAISACSAEKCFMQQEDNRCSPDAREW
jgi:hypothetical protein